MMGSIRRPWLGLFGDELRRQLRRPRLLPVLWPVAFARTKSRDKYLKTMKQRFLNQKLGKRNSRRAELQKAKRLMNKSGSLSRPKPPR